MVETLLFVYFTCNVLYLLMFAVASHFVRKNKTFANSKKRKFAVFVPAYKEDLIICDTAQKALSQNYPTDSFDVIIIADSLLPATISNLKKLPIKLVEVVFEESTKAKALNYTMKTLGDAYDVAVVLDADNIMCNDFLSQINTAFDQGASIVQGHRVAKNSNSSFAILDGISEEINNSIFRQGHRALGLSSALIGSGMAFDYGLYKEAMRDITSVGEDKELEFKLLRDGQTINYLPSALVYDEKVQNAQVLSKQKSRWIYAQLSMLRENFVEGFRCLLAGNFDFFDKVIQQMLLPRSIMIGLSGVMPFLFLFIETSLPITLWLSVLFLFFVSLMLAVPSKLYNKDTFKALYSLPQAIVAMFMAFFRIKKTFTHTPHSFVNK